MLSMRSTYSKLNCRNPVDSDLGTSVLAAPRHWQIPNLNISQSRTELEPWVSVLPSPLVTLWLDTSQICPWVLNIDSRSDDSCRANQHVPDLLVRRLLAPIIRLT